MNGSELGVVLADVLEQQLAAALPGRHRGEDRRAQHEREPAALRELERARGDEQRVDARKTPVAASAIGSG